MHYAVADYLIGINSRSICRSSFLIALPLVVSSRLLSNLFLVYLPYWKLASEFWAQPFTDLGSGKVAGKVLIVDQYAGCVLDKEKTYTKTSPHLYKQAPQQLPPLPPAAHTSNPKEYFSVYLSVLVSWCIATSRQAHAC